MMDPETPKQDDQRQATGESAATERSGSPAARDFAIAAARLLRDNKCEGVVVLDVRGKSTVTDYIVIGSGTSDRQMRSTLEDVGELGEGMGLPAARLNEDDRAVWLLADCVDVVVHLFEPNTRAHYDLEMLWGDAGRVEWSDKPTSSFDDPSRNLAGLSPEDQLEHGSGDE
ncbi:MAG: ribosome silencing factor [Planctomycetota bacterium]